jgi:hypothetical protein
MAQRSFSIKQLDELYLCYDKGQNGATIQKMSRALTPNDDTKVGKIISLSFDPNRDDKFDALLVETALNLLKSKKPSETDIREQLKRILGSIDIFSCTEGGAIPIDVDSFVESSLQRNAISRVMGLKTDVSGIPNHILVALAQGKIDYVKDEIKDKAIVGKTKESEEKSKKTTPPKTKSATKVQIQKVREMLVTIYENSDILLKSAKQFGAKNMNDSFRVFEEQAWEEDITQEFEIDYEIIKWLFVTEKINSNWVNYLHN